MTKYHAIAIGPLLVGVVAIIFCIWSALGNDVNICVTTGCTLYEDFSLGGISLWWIGIGAFACLCVCALLGQRNAGRILAAFFLFGDCWLLLLMALTAPCISCLIIAFLFALSYFLFRRKYVMASKNTRPPLFRSSILLWIWAILFIVNLGQVARYQFDVWPMLDVAEDGNMRMFFSPSCRYCIKGVEEFSGNINVGFYPIAENESDVAQINKMIFLLNDGISIADALNQSKGTIFNSFWDAWNPDTLILRFRLLRNKSHLYAQGSQSVPFFERKGLPLKAISDNKVSETSTISRTESKSLDSELPEELLLSGQCGSSMPCPPNN